MVTTYRTYASGELLYEGEDLETAVRTWDHATYYRVAPAGGVAVATYDGEVQVRDGWILHVTEDGHVYLNPRIGEKS